MALDLEREQRGRLLFYSPDAVGLGHVRRLMKIAHLLVERRADVAVLLVTGCATARPLERRLPNFDYVKLPSLKKVGPEHYQSRDLPLPVEDLSDLRARLIFQTVATLRPHIMFVDHNPIGVEGELRMALRYLRKELPKSRIVLGLRDIVNDPQTVRSTWQQKGIYDVLERYYDLILVYGTPDIFDLIREYAIPASIARKLRYCGYLSLDHPPKPADRVREEFGIKGKFVVASAGGGVDGYPLLDCFLEALSLGPPALESLVITGPLMTQEEQKQLAHKARLIPNCTVRKYVPDLPSVMAAADLVVSMYGYNIATELAALKKPAIVVPRTWPSQEQLLRARIFAERGLMDLILPNELTPAVLAKRLEGRLNGSPVVMPAKSPLDLEGLSRIVDHLVALLEKRVGAQAVTSL